MAKVNGINNRSTPRTITPPSASKHALLTHPTRHHHEPIACPRRLQAVANRLCASQNPEQQRLLADYDEQARGNERGPYNTSGKKRNQETMAVFDEELIDDGTGHIVVQEGKMVIKASWANVHQLVVNGKLPDSWTKVFDNCEDLGDAAKEEAKFYL